MPARHAIYRTCIQLYPPSFRRHYGDDLVQQFDDLVVSRGRRRACLRTALDLLVTVPTYQLERTMSQPRHATIVVVLISLFVAAGAASILTGVGPALVFVGIAVVIGIAQRSTLAKALRTPVAGLRRRRLITSAVLAGIFVVCAGVYAMVIGDTWTTRDSFLAGIGTLAMIAAPIFLLVGLLTPKADGVSVP